jgi:pimeloyl-ACP methyl ester carboxylesterase
MDGTGKLFEPLVGQLGHVCEIQVVEYPRDRPLSYSELEALVRPVLPTSHPFVLLGESFSSPLAVALAANAPLNLKGLILCAGFVRSPVHGLNRRLYSLIAPLVIGKRLPDRVIRWLLAGPNAPPALLAEIQSAISSVAPSVMTYRLRTILACDARAELAKVHIPILYLQAEQDRLVGPECLDDIPAIKPLTVARITGSHLLLQCEPEKSAAAIEAWLRKLTNCGMCGCELNIGSNPLSGDCGGDCWGCISRVEAEMMGVSLEEYRADPSKFLPPV